MGDLARSTPLLDGKASGAKRKITLIRAHVLGGKGKVVPKRECPVLESTLAGIGSKGPGELHLGLQQTAVDGVLLVDDTRSSKLGKYFYFEAVFGITPDETTS